MTQPSRDSDREDMSTVDRSTLGEKGSLASAYAPPPRRSGFLCNANIVGVLLVVTVAVVVFVSYLAG